MGTNYYAVSTKHTVTSPLHIGKYSGGEPPVFTFREYMQPEWEIPDVYECKFKMLDDYESWIEYLRDGEKSGSIVIMDEYDNEYTFDDFVFKMFGYPENGDKERTHIRFRGSVFS